MRPPIEGRPWVGGYWHDPGVIPAHPGVIPARSRVQYRPPAGRGRCGAAGAALAAPPPPRCPRPAVGPPPWTATRPRRAAMRRRRRGTRWGTQCTASTGSSACSPASSRCAAPGGREGAGGGPGVGQRRGRGDTRGDPQGTDPGPSGDTVGKHREPSGAQRLRAVPGVQPGPFPPSRLSQVIAPAEPDPAASPERARAELDEEMENDICKVWDMSMDEVRALCGTSGRGCPECSVRILVAAGEGRESSSAPVLWPCSRPARCAGQGEAGHRPGAAPGTLTAGSVPGEGRTAAGINPRAQPVASALGLWG